VHDPNSAVLAAMLIVLIWACVPLVARGRPETHKRGVRIADGRRLQRRCARNMKSTAGLLTLAGISIPALDEAKHFKIIGATGTGKSTAIRELLAGALARGDRAVFADPDAAYMTRFYDRYRGDIVLNPFDPDSAKWDLFGEIDNSYDVEHLVSGLIPGSEDAAASEWRGYARTFLAALVRRCRSSGRLDVADLWRLLNVASAEELRPILSGTPAQPFLDPDNSRMLGSIRSVAASATAAFEHIASQRAGTFSVRKWVARPANHSVLFIPYRAGQISALRSMIATWMRLAIFEAMSQPQGHDQRLWFVVDELDALGAIDGLKDALSRLRKFGGRSVLGFQSIAQVSLAYCQ
jgi:type IV secretory pathway TraG/TraD family ATPase VirD4